MDQYVHTNIDLWELVCQPEPDKFDHVLPGLLAGTVGAIVSPGGVGKSWISAQVLLQIATGKDLLGLGDVTTGAVAYLNAEDDMTAIRIRMWHLLQRLGPLVSAFQPQEGYAPYFSLEALLGCAPCLLDAGGNKDEFWVDYVWKAAKGRRLLILDTLRKFHRADENSSAAMTDLTNLLDRIARDTGCAILFCHHSNKLAMADGRGDEAGASRGSSALVDNIRWQWNLVRMTPAEQKEFGIDDASRKRWMRLVGAKNNNGEELSDLWLYKGANGVPESHVLKKIEKERKNGREKA